MVSWGIPNSGQGPGREYHSFRLAFAPCSPLSCTATRLDSLGSRRWCPGEYRTRDKGLEESTTASAWHSHLAVLCLVLPHVLILLVRVDGVLGNTELGTRAWKRV